MPAVGELALEKRQRRSEELKQIPPGEAPKASEPGQQQPPTNQEEAPDPNEPHRQSERQPPVLPIILQRPPAWFEGEHDGRRFYFHEPSGTSQWNPPYAPFTPTTTAAL